MPKDHIYDLAIIGGGINGCGIARDAAGRGLDVVLCEQGDLGQGTSSASTKLIHGGLRYLEHYEFGLVRQALIEREVLLAAAPHIIRPLRFVLPHHKKLRPAWLLRLGLFIYDHLGGRKILPGTKTLDLTADAIGAPLQDEFQKGFEYSDCWVDDARLVVLNAMDARERGAEILVRTKCVSASREGDLWRVVLEDDDRDQRREIVAKALVNAGGPWVERVIDSIHGPRDRSQVRLVRGSHIVVPRLYDHDRSYIFQNADGRIFFAIPYEGEFTLIGTTDEDHEGNISHVRISDDETRYLCDAAKQYFKNAPGVEDVVWAYAGVRPLYDDGATAAQEATRDYVLNIELAKESGDRAPLLNVFGGKITTYRKLAEAALRKLTSFFPAVGNVWTKNAPLPGGDFPVEGVSALIADLQEQYPFVDKAWAMRLIRSYGTRAWDVLGDAASDEDMGDAFGATLTVREVVYLMKKEWARTAEDVVWRRSKLGLFMTTEEKIRLDDWMRAYLVKNQTAAA